MSGSTQQTFERWQRTGDPAALGALFDACASNLLRLAIHLVGDAARAEDLVQSTFLAAIEQRGEIDTARPFEPWLAGVLTRKAKESKRVESRRPDPREVLARAERSPLDEAIASEFGGDLARALDRLREPYRSVLVLRLRHGLAPADIAHALDRSPNVVRVQLHRGLEELRRSLPAGVAGVALLALGAPRGLASVREAVVAAASQPAAWTAATLAGGVLLTKKLVIGGVTAALLAAWIWVARESPPSPVPGPGPFAADVAPMAAAPDTEADSTATIDSPEVAERVAASSSDDLPARITGRVFDARTGEGLAGVHLRLFPSRTGKLHELAVAQGPYARHGPGGRPWVPSLSMPLALSVRDGTPIEYGLESLETNQGLEPVRIYDAPQAGGIALADATSSSDGQFNLAAPALGGVVVVEQEGFASRTFAAPQPEGRWKIGLRPAWTLSGVVIDPLGEVVREPLHLSFSPNTDRSIVREVGSEAGFTEEFVAEAAWTCDSRSDGTFAVELGGVAVRPNVLTAGWVTRNTGVHPETHESYVFDQQFTPEESGQTAWVVAQGVPLLEVRDAATKAPLEDLLVTTFENDTGFPRTCGRFRAPGGRVTLSMDDSPYRTGSIEGRRVVVGAPGYRSKELLVTHGASAERHIIELEPGSEELVRGWVLDAGKPVAGALVTMGPWHRGWNAESTAAIDAARTDQNGAFELDGLEGRWVVQARSGERLVARELEIPVDGVRIDLADPTGFVVRVIDETGAPRPAHVVAFLASTGRGARSTSNDLGIARIAGLEPGTWQVRTSRIAGDGPRTLDIGEKCELGSGEVRELELRVPRPDPNARYRLVLASGAAPIGWMARFTGQDWTDIAPDGTLESSDEGAGLDLEVEAPGGRRWKRRLDPGQPVGDLLLEPEGPGYAGVLRRSDDGSPLGGVRVSLRGRGAAGTWHTMSSPTDSDGRFEVRGRAGSGWNLTFEHDGDRAGLWSEDATFAGLTFVPGSDPAVPPTAIEVRLPLRHFTGSGGVDTVRVQGRVVGPQGDGLADQVVLLNCTEPQQDGRVQIDYGSSRVMTGGDGRFSVMLPATDRVEVIVIDDEHKDRLRENWDRATLANGGELLLRVP